MLSIGEKTLRDSDRLVVKTTGSSLAIKRLRKM